MARETIIFESKIFGVRHVDMRTEAEVEEDKIKHEKIKKTWTEKVPGSFWNGWVEDCYLFYLPKRSWMPGDYGYKPESHYAFLVNKAGEITQYTDNWGREFEIPPMLMRR